jgi:polo-like kinase 1
VYVESKRTAAGSVDDRRIFRLADYPADLHKKVTLLKHFRSYLIESSKENAKPDMMSVPPQEIPQAAASSVAGSGKLYAEADSMPLVEKWMRTRHAIIFRLSNQIIQVCCCCRTV